MNGALAVRPPSSGFFKFLILVAVAYVATAGVALAPVLAKRPPAKVCTCAHCTGAVCCCCGGICAK